MYVINYASFSSIYGYNEIAVKYIPSLYFTSSDYNLMIIFGKKYEYFYSITNKCNNIIMILCLLQNKWDTKENEQFR